MMINDRDTFLTVSVSDKPNYITNISILNRPLIVKVGYNTRNKLRWITVTDQSNRPLLTQTFLKHKKICQFNFTANRHGLNFSVTLRQKDTTKEIPSDYDYLNWSSDFDLYFLGRTQDTENRLKANWRKVYVGG